MPELLPSESSPVGAESLLSAYNHRIFDALIDPDDAYKQVTSLNGEELIRSSIRDVFVRHAMCDKFGVTLLHRHFDMDADEKLVAVGNTSTPWSSDAIENGTLGKVIPQAFIFSAPDQIAPSEYTFFTNDALTTAISIGSAPKAFVEELGSLLFALKLEKVLGLRTVSGRKASHDVEFTVGRANIFVELDKPADNATPTSWYFCPDHANPDKCKLMHCIVYCVKMCVTSGGKHVLHHQQDHRKKH